MKVPATGNRTLFHYTVLFSAGVASLLSGASLVHNIIKPDLVMLLKREHYVCFIFVRL